MISPPRVIQCHPDCRVFSTLTEVLPAFKGAVSECSRVMTSLSWLLSPSSTPTLVSLAFAMLELRLQTVFLLCQQPWDRL